MPKHSTRTKGKMYFKCKTLSLFHILGRRWTVDVVEILSKSKKVQFNTMLDTLSGITPRALSNILADMSAAEVVERVKTSNTGATRTAYALTSKGLAFEKFIRSGKQLGVNLYSIDAGCVDRSCSNCRFNALSRT